MAADIQTESLNASIREGLANIRKIDKESGAAAAERATIEFLKEQPKAYQGFVMLARLLAKQKRMDDASRAAEKAKALAPLEIEPLLALGFIGMRAKDYPAAAGAFAEAINLDPSSARAHLGAAAIKMMDESYDEAMVLCEKTLDLDPSLERAHELMARINIRKGDKDQAIGDLKTLITNNPNSSRLAKAFVRLMKSEKREDEALTFLTEDVKSNPGDRRRVYRLARFAVNLGKPDVAVEQYKKLASGKKARATDKIRYISALTVAGKLDEAEAKVAELGDRRVFQAVAAKLRGDIAFKAEDNTKALEYYRKSCSIAQIPAPSETPSKPDELVKLWRVHSRKALIAAVKQRRAEKA